MIGRKRDDGGVEEGSAGVTGEPGPETTPPATPVDDTGATSEASGDPGTTQVEATDADLIEEVPNDDVEVVGAADGYIERYPDSPNEVHACAACGHNHMAGQFMKCTECGADISHPA